MAVVAQNPQRDPSKGGARPDAVDAAMGVGGTHVAPISLRLEYAFDGYSDAAHHFAFDERTVPRGREFLSERSLRVSHRERLIARGSKTRITGRKPGVSL